jgi:hypothetical protein
MKKIIDKYKGKNETVLWLQLYSDLLEKTNLYLYFINEMDSNITISFKTITN